MSFWDDPVFGGTQANQPTIPEPTLKQSVGKIELTEDQLKLYEEEPPKFTSWEGFWADPIFKDVTGRQVPVPEGETRDFWKYEVDESVSLASLFPELSSSAFASVAFRQSAVEWWSKPIRDKPAGLYLRTEIEFNGLLDEVFDVFKQFLGELTKPTLRLSAYLGVTQQPDLSYTADGLTFTGSLLGLHTPLPPVLELVTILSVGVEVNVGRTNTAREIESPLDPAKSPDVSVAVLGELHVQLPGLTGPLLLKYKATISDDFLRLDMTIPGNGDWQNPLGIESLSFEGANFVLNIPRSQTAASPDSGKRIATGSQIAALAPTSEDQKPHQAGLSGYTQARLDSSLSISVSADWKTSSCGTVKMSGVIYKEFLDASYIQGRMEKVTWSDIKKIFSDIHGDDLQSTDHDITCEALIIRVSKAQLLLTGNLTVDGRYLASATIAITSAGILVRANVKEWKIDDGYITIEDASLTLMVGKATEGPTNPERENKTLQEPKGGWYGGLEVAGRVTIKEGISKPISINVTLAAGKQGKEWFWVICGSMSSDLSLRDFVSSIDESSDLDIRLKSINLIAASTNDPKCNLNSNGYIIRQGFYLWATIETIPFVKMGDKIKQPAKGDATQLAIGWKKGSKIPEISIMLPPSLKIDIGPRFQSTRFELQVGSNLGVRFVGGFRVRLDDQSEWLQFQLAASVDPVNVAGELIFTGHINNPLGLCRQITIGPKLAVGLKFNWVQLAATGLPMGAGILGSFYLGDVIPANAYDMALYVCENPKDMLIKVNAPMMDYYKLIQFVGAVMDADIPTLDMTILQMKDVEIYSSLGVSLGGEYFPPGFRFKGTIIVFDHEAGMDCSLTTEGFRLKAWLQTIELGPLKIGGNVALPHKPGVTFALLDLEVNLKTQKFFLSGFVELFSLRASIDLYIQLMPTPAFYFDFQLQWSDLLSIKARAMMVSTTQEKSLTKKLANADWTISVEIEQRIIQQMVETIRAALKAVHEAAQAKIEAAQQSVADAERKYKAAIEDAQRDLEMKKLEYNRENDELDRRIAQLDRETLDGKSTRQTGINNARTSETNSVQEARLNRDRKLDEKRLGVKTAEQNLNNKETQGRNDENSALSDRERKKQDFMAKFGDAEDSIRKARSNVDSARNSVNSIKRDIDDLTWQLDHLDRKNFWRAPDLSIQIAALGVALGTAQAGLAIADAALAVALGVMTSPLFEEMKQIWYRAMEAFETMKTMVKNAIDLAIKQLNEAKDLLAATELLLRGEFDEAARKAADVVKQAQANYDDYAAKQRLEAEKLSLQLRTLENSVKSTAVTAAEGALELAKNNNIAFKAAQAGLEAIKKSEEAIYTTLDGIVQAAGSICDIRTAKLNGTLTADKQKQKPFKIYVEGTIIGKQFDLNLDYTPGQTGVFLKNMASAAIKEAV